MTDAERHGSRVAEGLDAITNLRTLGDIQSRRGQDPQVYNQVDDYGVFCLHGILA